MRVRSGVAVVISDIDAPLAILSIDRQMLAPPATTRERILTEASRLFAERGYDGTSTRQIADAVGIRQPSLFHHFASKQAIMEALLDLTYAAPADVAERLAGEPGPAADRLGEYVRWDVAYTLGLPYDLSAAVAGDVLEQPAFARFRRDRDRLHAARRRIIEQGIAAGEFVRDGRRLRAAAGRGGGPADDPAPARRARGGGGVRRYAGWGTPRRVAM